MFLTKLINKLNFSKKICRNFSQTTNFNWDFQLVDNNLDDFVSQQIKSTQLIYSQVELEKSKKQIQTSMTPQQAIHNGRIFIHYQHFIQKDWENILKVVEKNVNQIDVYDLKDCIWMLAKCDQTQASQISAQFLPKMYALIDTNISISDISLIFWSMSKHNIMDDELWFLFTERIKKNNEILNILDIFNICWALTQQKSQMSIIIDNVWLQMEQQLLKQYKKIDDISILANLIWSFAKSEKGSQKLQIKLASIINQLLPNKQGYGLSNLIWGIAKFNQKEVTKLIDWKLVQQKLLLKIHDMNEEELVIITWAFAKLQLGDQNLWEIMYSKLQILVKEKDQQININSICAVLQVLEQLKLTDDQQWIQVIELVQSKKHEIQANHLQTLVNLLVTRQKQSGVWQLFEEITLSKLDQLDAKSLSNIVQNFGNRRVGSQLFWDQIQPHILSMKTDFTNQGLVYIQWAYNRVNIKDKQLTDYILDRFIRNIDTVQSIDISMFIWSLGSINYQGEMVQELVSKIDDKFNLLDVSQQEYESLDLVQIIRGVQMLNLESEQFILKIENFLKVQLKNASEQTILKIFSSKANFSENFMNTVVKVIQKNIKNLKVDTLEEILKFSNQQSDSIISKQLLQVLEDEVIKRLREDQLNFEQISDLLFRFQINQESTLNFWENCETLLMKTKLFDNEYEHSTLERQYFRKILIAFQKQHKLSQKMMDISLKIMINMLQQNNFSRNHRELVDFGFLLDNRKNGNDQFWLLMQHQVSLQYESMKFQDLIRILNNLSNIRKGSFDFWKMIESYLVENQQKIFLYDDLIKIILGCKNFKNKQIWVHKFIKKLIKEKNHTIICKYLKNFKFMKRYFSNQEALENIWNLKQRLENEVNEMKESEQKIVKEFLEMIE